MDDCRCTMEAEISEIHTIVKSLDKKINGNGKIGLYDDYQRLKGIFYFVIFLLSFIIPYVLYQI